MKLCLPDEDQKPQTHEVVLFHYLYSVRAWN